MAHFPLIPQIKYGRGNRTKTGARAPFFPRILRIGFKQKMQPTHLRKSAGSAGHPFLLPQTSQIHADKYIAGQKIKGSRTKTGNHAVFPNNLADSNRKYSRPICESLRGLRDTFFAPADLADKRRQIHSRIKQGGKNKDRKPRRFPQQSCGFKQKMQPTHLRKSAGSAGHPLFSRRPRR